MKLKFQSKYLSIDYFEEVSIPEFTLLTGVNGSGKTHLMQAIQKGHVTVEGARNSRIVYFNYENFKLDNEASISPFEISNLRKSAWGEFINRQDSNTKGVIEAAKNGLGDHYLLIKKMSEQKELSIWQLPRTAFEDESTFNAFQTYKFQIEEHLKNVDKARGDGRGSAYLAAIRKITKSLDECSEDEFQEHYIPYVLKGDFLPVQLGRIFADYFRKYDENEYRKFQNTSNGGMFPLLSADEFEAKNGPRPWVLVNELLSQFRGFPYRVNSPEGSHRDSDFKIKLVHQERPEVSPEFSELSSGERILLALVASIYKSRSDNQFPGILLLDEVDASLHPSMISNLLNTIREVFLKRGVLTLLATHSPTTIALAPEDSIHVVNPAGPKRIEQKNQNAALEILTEGFATLEKGVKLFDQVSRSPVTVISEGHNTKYLESALKHSGIENVEIVTGVENKTGKTQLKVLYDFFSKIPHDKKVIFVWDCDCVDYKSLPEVGNTVPFVFSRTENTLAKSGIENLFDEKLFTAEFLVTISKPNEPVLTNFHESSKSKFQQMILGRNNAQDFQNFRAFVEKVNSLLKSESSLVDQDDKVRSELSPVT
jgi:predicted ATPase